MRGKHARIVALELPLLAGRKRRAVIEAAERLGVPAVPHRVAEGDRSGARSGAAAVAAPEEDAHPGREHLVQERARLITPAVGQERSGASAGGVQRRRSWPGVDGRALARARTTAT